MEKFYIVNPESDLHKEYFECQEAEKHAHEKAKEFLLANDVEAAKDNRFCAWSSTLYIVPTKRDQERFGNILGKIEHEEGLRAFKGNSKIGKQWNELVVEHQIKWPVRPYPPFYFGGLDSTGSTQMFAHCGKLYLRVIYGNIGATPEGMVEIKGSEYFAMLEAANELRAAKRSSIKQDVVAERETI